jgi:formylmethanofuran dehydrogenase subunit E
MTTTLPKELDELRRFHGHLGPYAVIGYRMGVLAREKLGQGKMASVVETGLKPPISCIVDGIQLSTSCTLGKGNIRVVDKKLPMAFFRRGDKRLMIRLKDDLWKKIDGEMSKEKEMEHSLLYYNMPSEELFEIVDVLDVGK